MKYRPILWRLGGLIVVVVALLAHTPQPVVARSWLRWSYYVPDDSRSYASLAAHHAALDVVAPDQWRIQPDGSITSRVQPAVLAQMRSWGLQVFPMVQKYSWYDHMHPFLANPRVRGRAAAELARLVIQGGYPGIHLDIENIDRGDGPALQAFIADVGTRLHAQRRLLTLALPAKAVGEVDWYPAWNYAALGQIADIVVIMAYDHGYALGQPAPVAPIAWMNNVLSYTIQRIPPSKVVMGMPWYGYDWNTTTGSQATYVSYRDAIARGGTGRYDAATQAMVTQYRSRGTHTIWYENAQTVRAKLDTITAYGVRGWAAWRLGYEDPAVWNTLSPRR